jgi:hypothetical protein
MAVANRSLPVATTALILLATPVVGVVGSVVFFSQVATSLPMIAMAKIFGRNCYRRAQFVKFSSDVMVRPLAKRSRLSFAPRRFTRSRKAQ